jgi:hypothetical protein
MSVLVEISYILPIPPRIFWVTFGNLFIANSFLDQCTVLVNTAMNSLVPYNTGKFLNSCTTGGFSTRAQLHEVIKLNRLYMPIYFFMPLHSVFSKILIGFLVHLLYIVVLS